MPIRLDPAAAEARGRIAAGVDPFACKGAAKPPATSFGRIKDDWLAKVRREGRAPATIDRAERLAKLATPLDPIDISEIRPPDILDLLRPVEAAGHLETARRLRAFLSGVFRFGVAIGVAENDPAALLRGAIASPRPTHRAAIVERDSFARLMQAIAAYEGRGSLVREALLMLALTAARPGELRLAQWDEFDLEAGVWTVPESRMKMRQPHRAPLARQTLDILHRLKGEDGKARPPSPLVFPSARPARPLSENAFNVALRTMGFAKEKVSAHGFRSSFSTLANESRLWSYDAIERALAHQDGSDVRRAYHRADYFEERRKLMQWWADELERMICKAPEERPGLDGVSVRVAAEN